MLALLAFAVPAHAQPPATQPAEPAGPAEPEPPEPEPPEPEPTEPEPTARSLDVVRPWQVLAVGDLFYRLDEVGGFGGIQLGYEALPGLEVGARLSTLLLVTVPTVHVRWLFLDGTWRPYGQLRGGYAHVAGLFSTRRSGTTLTGAAGVEANFGHFSMILEAGVSRLLDRGFGTGALGIGARF